MNPGLPDILMSSYFALTGMGNTRDILEAAGGTKTRRPIQFR